MKRKEIDEMAVKDLRERLEVEKQNLNKMKMNHVYFVPEAGAPGAW